MTTQIPKPTRRLITGIRRDDNKFTCFMESADGTHYSNGIWLLVCSIFKTKPHTFKDISVRPLPTTVPQMLRDAERTCTVPLTITDELIDANESDWNRKHQVRVLRRESGTPLYLDNDFVLWMQKLDGLKLFAGRTLHDPVRIEANGQTVGIVSPIQPPKGTL
jgi:hypothetical protein